LTGAHLPQPSKISCETVEDLADAIPDSVCRRSRFSVKGLSDRLQLELGGDARIQ